jgi:epoxyqueuosine reductase
MFNVTGLEAIENLIREAGFEHFGYAPLTRPLTFHVYENWLNEGHHGEMEYLSRHSEMKADPKKLLPQAKSAIVVTHAYKPHPFKKDLGRFKNLKIGSYAEGDDYHFWLKSKLDKICLGLKELFPDEEFRSFTDSGPVLERDLATRAGLGWIGKNTCLIDRKRGSFFLIGEIYTSLMFHSQMDPSPNHCGTCNKCIASCPTGALKSPQVLDARLCISYLTIESKKPAPVELREKMSDWFFGCDICQEVCPWNEKIFSPQVQTSKDHADITEDLKWILTASHNQILKEVNHTPLHRAGALGLKRNALTVAGNLKLKSLSTTIAAYQNHETLGELAQWALKKISN